ncbi:putative cytochrome P450 [Diplogelasinospora grovesii]|uniref:Cytochrome P450 n=1 Tax=Diplogelasinospora grovesii TaxID=303347 RepID=A0AAN6SAQ1_9PEZI|nr:putative cytochrome P450 [Diplogelasinospora grovesii]
MLSFTLNDRLTLILSNYNISLLLPLAAILLFSIYVAATAVYNLYFHPLASFPGPFWARCSLLWRLFNSLSGKLHLAIEREHKKHGSVFRVSPNELSFASVSSWKDIYGHPTGGRPTMVKSEFYDLYGAGFKSLCVGSERDPHRHGQMRKSLSSAFSTKSLSEQEHIVNQVVDKFIDRIGEVGEKEGSKGVNVTKWYEMVSFDILGEMAFGESFHCVQNGKPHFWSELVLDHLYFITLADNLHRFPIIPYIVRTLFPSTLVVQNRNSKYSREIVAKRLATKSSRKDFLTTLVSKYESGEMEKEELTAHSSTLVIAGGETTTTFLSSVNFYLLKNPGAYRRLTREIRERFARYEDINSTAAQQLPYLQAVINEGLRIYPPGSQGFPRVSPGATIDGHYIPRGVEVYTSAWTVTHDEANFKDAMAFRPERWLDPESTDIKEASQPFSLGPRGCLGRNFAYMQINLLLAKILWTYDLELTNPETDWEGESLMYVMWWKPAAMVRFSPRSLSA